MAERSPSLLIAKNASTHCELLPGLANRHVLITGATGTGKTVTLQTMAENFSKIGVPVFMADVKGDLSGISQTGSIGEKMAGVLKERGIATTQACSHHDLAHHARPDALAFFVLPALAVLNICPFTVTCHGNPCILIYAIRCILLLHHRTLHG